MNSTRTLAQRSAAAGFPRATGAYASSVSMRVFDATAHAWTESPSIATGTKRDGLNPTPRPEEAGP